MAERQQKGKGKGGSFDKSAPGKPDKGKGKGALTGASGADKDAAQGSFVQQERGHKRPRHTY